MADIRRVVWSDTALDDLDSIEAYIADAAPIAASRLAGRLVAAARSLAVHADRGRPVGGDLRELVVVSPYVIRYFIEPETVRIVRIRHAARKPT